MRDLENTAANKLNAQLLQNFQADVTEGRQSRVMHKSCPLLYFTGTNGQYVPWEAYAHIPTITSPQGFLFSV